MNMVITEIKPVLGKVASTFINLDQDLSDNVQNFGIDEASVGALKLYNGWIYLEASFYSRIDVTVLGLVWGQYFELPRKLEIKTTKNKFSALMKKVNSGQF